EPYRRQRQMCIRDSQKGDLVFFDRGVVHAAVALEHSSGIPYSKTLGQNRHYFETIFLAPPWSENFSQDKDRRHGFSAAIDEFSRLERAFCDLGYDIVSLPKVSPSARANFVLNTLKGQ
ncbi:MAG: AAA family ATPase, partial [Parvibaculaceae bacterium]|nr:AAA family ATPase [Parvibaculaceae bacterium]